MLGEILRRKLSETPEKRVKKAIKFRLASCSCYNALKGLFHPACLARVVSWFAFVVAIFMGHENGFKQRLPKRRHVQGMLDERDL